MLFFAQINRDIYFNILSMIIYIPSGGNDTIAEHFLSVITQSIIDAIDEEEHCIPDKTLSI